MESPGFASLCILSFERLGFLSHCIDSAKKAGVPVEIIVHDDGSKDPELLRYLHDLQRIGEISTVILNAPGHNQGVGTAMNRMFKIASGDPIVKIDQDLEFLPNWMVTVNQILDSDPAVGLLGLFKYWHDPVDWRKTLIAGIAGSHSYHTDIVGSAMAIRRSVWEALGPFDEHSEAFAEDWTFKCKTMPEDGRWLCALPENDLVFNHGFGPPHSTVVQTDPSTESGLRVASIYQAPYLF